MAEINSVQSIINALAEMAEKKMPVDVQVQMEAAVKINALLQGEYEKLAGMESVLNKIRSTLIQEGKSVAAASAAVEATDEWLAWRIQNALVETAKEQIRLSKKNADLTSDLMRTSL